MGGEFYNTATAELDFVRKTIDDSGAKGESYRWVHIFSGECVEHSREILATVRIYGLA